VFLGLGATAHQMNCPAAVESLVRYGGWNGEVYMITDHGDCFDKKQIIKNAGMQEDKFHMIVIDEDFGGGGIDINNPKVGFSKNRLRSKSMKTQLFDLIPDTKIQVLAYADCDIIFAKEGCPAEFAASNLVPWEERNIKFSRVVANETTGKLTSIHTGTILMHREHSREVLSRWYNRLNSGVDDMDRASYLMEYAAIQEDIDARMRIANSNGTKVAPHVTIKNGNVLDNIMDPKYKNVMMPSQQVKVSKTGVIEHYELFINPESDYVPCMIHVSKARCGLFGRKAVQNYLDRFQLRTYRNGYPYCPNPFFAPILYGWFPLSYIPFCPKIEIFM
jgi:hypothetical protein